MSIYLPPVRVLLETHDSMAAGSTMLPVPMDFGLQDALVSVVGCGVTTMIRDANGKRQKQSSLLFVTDQFI